MFDQAYAKALQDLEKSKRVSKALAEALDAAKKFLDTAPMSAPYNDRSNEVRVAASAALARYREGL